MIRIEGDWVVFHAEDNDVFYPKQWGDELRINWDSRPGVWHRYNDDLRNGYLTFTAGTSVACETEHRRPLSMCTPEQLTVIKGGHESEHFI